VVDMKGRGVENCFSMFSEITSDGVKREDDQKEKANVILSYCIEIQDPSL